MGPIAPRGPLKPGPLSTAVRQTSSRRRGGSPGCQLRRDRTGACAKERGGSEAGKTREQISPELPESPDMTWTPCRRVTWRAEGAPPTPNVWSPLQEPPETHRVTFRQSCSYHSPVHTRHSTHAHICTRTPHRERHTCTRAHMPHASTCHTERHTCTHMPHTSTHHDTHTHTHRTQRGIHAHTYT